MAYSPLTTSIIASAVTALVVTGVFGGIIYANPEMVLPLQNDVSQTLDFPEETYSARDAQIIQTVKKANPAVVSIIITKDIPIVERYYQDPFGFGIPQYRENGTEKKEVGGGSGFIVTKDGYVVTNKHVVSEEDAEYTVFTKDGTEYKAKVVAKDPANDIAILKISDSGDFPYLTFGNSENLQVGQSVMAIGNPLLEFSNSVSVGIVSGLSRSVIAGTRFGQPERLEGVIQTDAAINLGNSGGPLINLRGEVIGVNVAMASAENIGFALPGNMVKEVVESIKEHGEIIRPYIGIRYVEVTKAVQEANNLKYDYGALIVRGETKEQLAVIPGSPADKADLEEGDIILEFNGKKLDGETSFARLIMGKKVNEKVELTVLSEGEEKKVTVTLEKMPTQK